MDGAGRVIAGMCGKCKKLRCPGTGADVSFRQDQTFWRFEAANLPRSLTTS